MRAGTGWVTPTDTLPLVRLKQVNVAFGATGTVPEAGIGGAVVRMDIYWKMYRKRLLLYVHWVYLDARTITQSSGQTGLLRSPTGLTGTTTGHQGMRQATVWFYTPGISGSIAVVRTV